MYNYIFAIAKHFFCSNFKLTLDQYIDIAVLRLRNACMKFFINKTSLVVRFVTKILAIIKLSLSFSYIACQHMGSSIDKICQFICDDFEKKTGEPFRQV